MTSILSNTLLKTSKCNFTKQQNKKGGFVLENEFYPKSDDDLEIHIDFFKVTGKWKYGGKVNVGKARLYNGQILQAIVDNQNIIHDGWQDREDFIVVINDTAENWENPNYSSFNKAVFLPNSFKGLKRKKEPTAGTVS